MGDLDAEFCKASAGLGSMCQVNIGVISASFLFDSDHLSREAWGGLALSVTSLKGVLRISGEFGAGRTFSWPFVGKEALSILSALCSSRPDLEMKGMNRSLGHLCALWS